LSPPPPFVLVHGSWHGAWCWRDVVPLIAAAGHRVFTPTLAGLGERAGELAPSIDLDTHVGDVLRLVLGEDLHDVVLVGHSYAGVVITAAAARAPERLRQLLYVDAYVPGPGQCLLDLWPEAERRAALAEIGSGSGVRPTPSAIHLGITDPETAAWVDARLTPHPLRTYAGAVPAALPGPSSLPRAYLHCTEGPTVARFGAFATRARAAGWPVREIASGHDVMLAHPRECAAALLALAGGEDSPRRVAS
jgi:pimeloyl-ACP methyl ester carboxylesterase